MFGGPGVAYVYFIYGSHHCMNVVAHLPGEAGAVLLRGAEPMLGLGTDPRALAGPGKLARAFGLTTAHTGFDLVRSDLHLRAGEQVSSARIARSVRVGIAESVTSARLWRYALRGSPGVSHT
jgi:DNA-3-methyladenine glycosylase